VLVSDERGRRVAVSTLGPWLRRVAPSRARGVVHIAVVSDARMRALNRRYRRKDRVTDVLSFPVGRWGRQGRSGRDSSHQPYPPHQPGPPLLGDIVIARGVAARQAREAGHQYATELRVLALHGLLHLLGYDHERDEGRMRRAEARLRRRGGLREGLIERNGPGGRGPRSGE
jgi:probable rRNA maturation factor